MTLNDSGAEQSGQFRSSYALTFAPQAIGVYGGEYGGEEGNP